MTTFSENIEKIMGWCPQKQIDFFQEKKNGSIMHCTSLNLNTSGKNNGSIEQMDVPLYFFDWRNGAIILVLFISYFFASITAHINGTPLSYLVTILIMVTSLILLFLSYHYRLSINSEKLLINTPLLLLIQIPKSQIKSIENIENIIYKQKHNWVNIVFILSILFITIFQFHSLYRQIAISKSLEDAVMGAPMATFIISIYIIIFYRHSYCSYYPRAIRIESGNELITLCPRTEFEFNKLMEELKR